MSSNNPSRSQTPREPGPRLTIGLPVFNGDRYLDGTIASILGQTFDDFRLVVSDNASTDGTRAIAQKYAELDDRVVYQRHPTNLGAHHNYNGILANVSTEYFKWAAHDDEYEPDFLRRCVETLDSHPDAALAFAGTVDIDDEGKPFRKRPFNFDMTQSPPGERFRTFLGAGNACLPVFGVARTKAVQSTGLLGHYAGSDRVFLAELSLYGTWREVPEELFLHREHVGQSGRVYPDGRMRRVWFDPTSTSPDPIFFKRMMGYLRAIARAPLSPRDRMSLYLLMVRWTIRRAPDLAGDVMAVVRGLRRRSAAQPAAG